MATAVWDRLLGCFGDSLLRKFGAEPPREWVGAIGALDHHQIERGMRRLLFSWKGGPPNLPEFMRLCRSVGSDEFDEGRSTFPQLTHDDGFKGDAWDMAANRYLLGHIAQRCKENPLHFGRPASYEMLQAPLKDLEQLGVDKHYLDASAEMVDKVGRLVAAKNAWAADMRDIAVKGEVPVEQQKSVWREYIARAEGTA